MEATTKHPGPTELNCRIARALGLDPSKIKRNGVTLTLDGETGPTLEVHYAVWSEQMANDFVGHIAKYRLVPIEDDET